MNAFLKLLAGLAVLALIGLAAFFIDGAPGSAASAQRKLEESAVKALGADAGAWASVTMDGQKAILSGTAPSEAARDALIARVAAAEGGGGLVAGGVTTVDAGALKVIAAPPVADPFIFIAEYENGVLAFSGYAPDQETRDAVYRLAGDLFPDTDISGVIDIAGGAPVAPESWRIAAETSLRALYYLQRGAVSAEGARFAVMGKAEDEVRAGAARMLMTAMPDGLAGESDIAVDEAAPPPAPNLPAPDENAAGAADTEQMTPARETCLEELQNAASALRIRFPSADSDLDAGAEDSLRALAALLADCPNTRLEITGHTDSLGQARDNLRLSLERARVVRDFLISAGAPAETVTADGAGESEPIANNATEAGRERNRRIEFEIISAQ
ncbi:OmpA family protein [Hyphococcus luteus]|uniref:OmpA-like domain-containing protein n=1 Tax=Hyphococcus luteus TaxID=2058213 RepID=A0A2S7JZK2_9PROT|nr:OmpA family protein [Marinicaulis flavus]PQA85691.1 hypothetical protein CW354_22455 [Marinicaulis flavus]